MQGHRLLRGVGILIIIVAIVYLLIAVGGAIWLGERGLGDGWGTGSTLWLTLPLAGGAAFSALMLVVFGLMLFFLAKIDDNIAEAERRRAEIAARPRVQPAVAEARVATVNLPDAPAGAVAAATAAAVAVAAADAEPEAVVAEEALVAPETVVVAAAADAPWEEPVAAAEEPAPAAEGEIIEDAPAVIEEPLAAAAVAATVLPSVEFDEPGEVVVEEPSALVDEPIAAAAAAAAAATILAGVESDEPGEVVTEETRGEAVVEVVELEVEAPPELEVDAPEGEDRHIGLGGVVAAAAAVGALAHHDEDGETEAAEVAAETAPAVEAAVLAAGIDDLNVPPELPDEVELPRIDVAAPEAELETEDMSGGAIALAGAALAAGVIAAGRDEPEAEAEPLVLAADTRLPEIEISEVAPEAEAAAAATLAAATGVPEEEVAVAAPAEPNEVAELKSEVASLKEMLAQLMAQMQPPAVAAAAGAAVAVAASAASEAPAPPAEPSEAPAAVDAAARLPGTDEVARIAAEVNAAAPRRPRTVAKPKSPEPAAEQPAAAEPAVEATPDPVAAAPAGDDAPTVVPPGEDNLELISGLGPIYAKRLRELGVTTYAQLAQAPYDVLHKVTRGNLERVIKEDWRGQARRLANQE